MRCTTFLTAWLVSAGTAAPAFASGLEVMLAPRASVSGPIVRVGDVADLSAVRGTDASLARRLADVQLATLGMGDSAVCLDPWVVQSALRRVAPAAGLRVVFSGGARCVRITPTLQRLSREQAVRAAVSQWRAACEAVADACVADHQSAASADADVIVPNGAVSFEAVIPANFLQAASRLTVPVRVSVDGAFVGVVPIPIEWHAVRPAWHVAAPIDRGQAVRHADLRPARVDTRDVRGDDVAYDPKSGLVRANRALTIGDLIVIDVASTIAEFRAGDQVPVVATVGNVRISRLGTAVQDGRDGKAAFVRFADGGLVASRVPRESSGTSTPVTSSETH